MVLVVSAPSGSGKTTLVHALLQKVGGLRFSISYTTRRRRPGEEDGRDYHFVKEARFQELRDGDELLEWAEVHGHLYGTSREAVQRILDEGADAVLDLDVQGAEAVRRALPRAVLIFVLPPDRDELQRRLEARGTPAGELRRRLENAGQEVRRAERFDYLLVNDRVEDAGAVLEAILLAERSRRVCQRNAWEEIVDTFGAG